MDLITKALHRWATARGYTKREHYAESDPAAEPRKVRPRPAALQFDTDETSEFGRQVAMMLSLQPDTWAVRDSLTGFFHAQLGEFYFDDNDRIQHRGQNSWPPGGMIPPGKQRALTRGDHAIILEALQNMLLLALPIEDAVATKKAPANAPANAPATTTAAAVMQQMQMQQLQQLQQASALAQANAMNVQWLKADLGCGSAAAREQELYNMLKLR